MKNIILLATLFTLATNTAFADDIYGKDGQRFIKVTEYTSDGQHKDYVGFALCANKSDTVCDQIGRRKYYSKAALASLRNSEKKDVAFAVLADVGVVIVAVYGGAFVGGVVAAGAGTATMVGASAGATLGTAGAATIITYAEAINPAEQYRQVEMLSSDIVNDKDVVINRDIDKIAHTLRSVLENLD